MNGMWTEYLYFLIEQYTAVRRDTIELARQHAMNDSLAT